MIGVTEDKKTFPGYLFTQFVIREKDSNEDLALLSILEKDNCFRTYIDGVNGNIKEHETYLDDLRLWRSDMFFEMLKTMSELLIENDLFNVKFCPILNTLIPFSDLSNGIFGTLSTTPIEESDIQWSLVSIE